MRPEIRALVVISLALKGCGGAEAEAEAEAEAVVCPVGMVRVDTACVDRFEARIEGQGQAITALPADHVPPADAVSWVDAERACRNANKRLCSRAEWLVACLGPTGTRSFPYGNEPEVGRCNHAAEGLNRNPELADGGEYEGCVTPEGIYDLVGNVGEWLSDTDASGDLRETIGGSFGTNTNYARCDYANRSFQPTGPSWSGQGFRCCADLGH